MGARITHIHATFARLEDDMEIADLDEYYFNLDYADNNPGEKIPRLDSKTLSMQRMGRWRRTSPPASAH